VPRVILLLSIAVCTLLLSRAASAGLVFPSVVERVIGTRIDMTPVREALSDTTAHVRVEVADAELYGIEELRTRDPLNFRQGRTASWKEEMPPDIERLFWEIHGDTMTRLGYARNG